MFRRALFAIRAAVRKFEDGFVQSIEMMVLMTVVMSCTMVMAMSMGSKLLNEAGDTGSALSSLNQSFTLSGMAVGHPNDPTHPTDITSWGGSSFVDAADFCDQNATCGIRMCIAPTVETP